MCHNEKTHWSDEVSYYMRCWLYLNAKTHTFRIKTPEQLICGFWMNGGGVKGVFPRCMFCSVCVAFFSPKCELEVTLQKHPLHGVWLEDSL